MAFVNLHQMRGRSGHGLTARQGEPTEVIELQTVQPKTDQFIDSAGADERPVTVKIAPLPNASIASPNIARSPSQELPMVSIGSGGGSTENPALQLLASGGGLSGRHSARTPKIWTPLRCVARERTRGGRSSALACRASASQRQLVIRFRTGPLQRTLSSRQEGRGDADAIDRGNWTGAVVVPGGGTHTFVRPVCQERSAWNLLPAFGRCGSACGDRLATGQHVRARHRADGDERERWP